MDLKIRKKIPIINEVNSTVDNTRYCLPYSWFLFSFFLLFIVYGSLIPLDFRSIDLDLAIEQFIALLQQPAKISRSDFAINVLITIPLSFSLSSVLYRYFQNRYLFIIAGTFFTCLFITLQIEFLQIYTNNRVSSSSDIIAQIIGTTIGLLIWQIKGNDVAKWFQGWSAKKEKRHFFEKVMWVYIVLLFIYNIMPLDLITTPVEIYYKWKEGRVQLVPFIFNSEDIFLILYQYIADSIIWFFVCFFSILSHYKTPAKAFFWTIKIAVLLEFLQLFVYSRFTDISDIITAIIGATLGVVISKYILKQQKAETNHINFFSSRTFLFFLLFLWSCILLSVFWYPYNFNFEKSYIINRMEFIYSIPLLSYFYTDEFVAINTVFQKLIFLLPVGILLGIIFYTGKSHYHTFDKIIAILWSLLLTFTIELGQIFIPNHTPDTTDIALGLLSIYSGFLASRYYFKHTGLVEDYQKNKYHLETLNIKAYNMKQKKRWLLLTIVFFQIISFIILIQLFAGVEKIPYNIRELFSQSNLIQHFFFICAALSSALLPLFLLDYVRKQTKQLYKLYPLLLLASILIFFLLLSSVPRESIYDIIGGPRLLWLWEWQSVINYSESIGRFAVLYASISWCMAGAYCLSNRKQQYMLSAFYLWILLSIIVFPISHTIIIIEAGTDNITELMRDNGTWLSSALVFILLYVLFYSTNLIGLVIAGIKQLKIKHYIFFLLSIPLSYQLAVYASEPFLFKYGKIFSALQFLLSPDRDHYLPQEEIFLYYILAYILVIIAIIWFQLLYWIVLRIKMNVAKETFLKRL